jgi:hypothetical protein
MVGACSIASRSEKCLKNFGMEREHWEILGVDTIQV